MNTNKYTRLILAAAVTLGAAACSENSWNKDLDGWEDATDKPIADQQSIEYTLTDADYSSIANNSTNKSLAGDEKAAALAAVGKNKYFSADATAAEFVPAFLASTSFPYFTLTEGSSVKLTHNVAAAADQNIPSAADVQRLTVKSDFYSNEVWESEEDFIEAFSPSKPASKYLTAFLDNEADANDGVYAVVSYKLAAQDPTFGESSQPVEVFSESFTESLGDFTIDNVLLPDLENSYVWSYAGSNYGAKASSFVAGVGYAAESWLISPEIDLTRFHATMLTFDHVYNKFPSADFAKENCVLMARKVGDANWTKVEIPNCTNNTSWTFENCGEISLAAFEGAKMQFAFRYYAEDGKTGTWEIKNLVLTGVPGAAKAASRAANAGVTTDCNAVYYFDGSKWTVPSKFVVLQPADYTAMGQTYQNLSKAEPYISLYLKGQFPYAAADDVKYVLWLHYANSATTYDCSKYVYDGTEWQAEKAYETVTEQFVRLASGWAYNPNVTITLPAGRNQEPSMTYYQACVDWVYENICKPLGDTDKKSGKFYVSSYGNNEYYSGTSAYQGNVDLRPSAAVAQYPTEYGSMTDDEIVALEKSRFMNEVMPGALSMLHADAKPVDGMEVLFTINFSVYDGASTVAETAVFKVVGEGKFEPVSCTWDK